MNNWNMWILTIPLVLYGKISDRSCHGIVFTPWKFSIWNQLPSQLHITEKFEEIMNYFSYPHSCKNSAPICKRTVGRQVVDCPKRNAVIDQMNCNLLVKMHSHSLLKQLSTKIPLITSLNINVFSQKNVKGIKIPNFPSCLQYSK